MAHPIEFTLCRKVPTVSLSDSSTKKNGRNPVTVAHTECPFSVTPNACTTASCVRYLVVVSSSASIFLSAQTNSKTWNFRGLDVSWITAVREYIDEMVLLSVEGCGKV